MINLITAIGNPYINEKIKNIKNYNVIIKDIQYPEGVIEILSINKNINLLLISTEIFLEYDFKIFIKNIRETFKSLEIIVFTENQSDTDIAFLNSNEIYKIYINNQLGYDEYLRNLNSSHININEQVKNDMKFFKKEILEKQNKNLKNKKIVKYNNNEENYFVKKNKVIMISGANGVGKSLFSVMFSKYIEYINKNVLIIDATFENSSINTIFGKFLNQKIQKVSKKIYYMNYKIFNTQNDYTNLKMIIDEIKNKYDYILIDTNNENIKINKNIINLSNNIIFLIEPNLIELQKAKRILDIYKYDFEIDNNKIKIVFNKTNKFQISEDILKEVFEEYEILEHIKYNPIYTLYINKNTREIIDNKIFEKIYEKLF